MKKTSYKSFKNKLTFKIPLRVISAVIAVIIAICVVLSIFLLALQQKSTMKEINYLAENNAYLATSYFNNLQTLSKSLAMEVPRYKELDSQTRDQLIKKSLSSIINDERVFSAFVAFEPNTMFQDTPDGLSYFEYKSGNEKKLDVLNDYTEYKDGEYYAVTKQSLKPYITEPYSEEETTGETVCLITISNPIVDENGKFLGVANVDILTDTITNLNYNLGGYKTSYNYILSADSNYVSNTADKEKAGTKCDEIESNTAMKVSQPLKIDGIESKWNSSFVVQKSEALSEATLLLLLIGGIGIIGIILIGIIIITLLKKSLSPINNIVALSENMGNGKLDSDISVNTNDELGELAVISKRTSQQLSEYIKEISHILGKISTGDFTAGVARDYVGDFAPIKEALLTIIDALNGTFSEIGVSTEQVSSGANEIATGAQALSQGATEQAASLEELSASINEITGQVKQNANNANNAKILAEDAEQELSGGKETIGEMIDAMNQIRVSSTEITKIIKTIDDIAFQTNILALNAAVEAARAGIAGKGFAVVADEVRNLASKSAEAAKHTTSLIEQSASAVENGTMIAGKTADLLNLIVEKFTGVNDLVTEIAVASSEQANSIGQIEIGVTQISAVVQTNSATAEESAAAAEELSAQANLLREKLSMFELKDKNN